eukprot:TRINITY_DN3018_c0_g1_i2.p1 TRINITY_DN3018_c0_g1~~TRINITY_DN3018_c0_g1_i2.p1  ORF type:complete len:316 (-),score=41.37 TRINITY_DN3018_c0_g1_i2:36-983(-)
MEGSYNIFFVNCHKYTVSMMLEVTQYNVDAHGLNYLSAGEAGLPTLYDFLVVAYFMIVLVWTIGYLRIQREYVNKMHIFMTVVLFLKGLSLFCIAGFYQSIKKTGHSSGWNIPYYIFAVSQGIMLFVVILLIGAGYSFIKPYLIDRDKKIFVVVVPLQIIANVALVIVDEGSPGSKTLSTWSTVWQIVDFICCGVILIHFALSLKHLRESSTSDGKAARSISKIKLFRKFYFVVLSYIYFTRIVVVFLKSALPYRAEWLTTFFTEAATLLFYSFTGYKFRPRDQSPYFNLEETSEINSEDSSLVKLGDSIGSLSL